MPRRFVMCFRLAVLLLLLGATSAHTAENRHPAMVAAAHPLAAEAGRDVLAAGGSAVDAAVAVQAVLGLVEPQSSGIGGGAFLVYYDAETGEITAYDGRETAPRAVDETLFLNEKGEPAGFFDVMLGGQAVGVPGIVAMLDMAHTDHGNLPWAGLFDRGIKLAEDGFTVTPRLHGMISRFSKLFMQVPDTADYFLSEDGDALPVGHRLTNPAYAGTLRRIAEGGADAFYEGPLAEAMVDAVQGAPVNPGQLTLADLAAYEPRKVRALCGPYRKYEICGMPPPTSGTITILQILGLLERFPLTDMSPTDESLVHLMSEASRLAYADRGRYIGDTAFVDVPVEGLLDRDYLAERSRLIDPGRAMETASPGMPPGAEARPDSEGDRGTHTSHFTIVDGAGNVLTMTTTVQIPFGSSLMVEGFLLNNELTDFDFRPRRDGMAVANRPQGGKKPRSSMSPTIVLDDRERPILAIGSPGGSRIIGYVAQSLVSILDNGLSVKDAVALPHHVTPGETTNLEAETPIADLKPGLEAMGHRVEVRDLNSGLHGITLSYGDDGTVSLEGGADPRREGVVLRAPQ